MSIKYPEPWECDVVYNTTPWEYDPEGHYENRYVKTVDDLPPVEDDNQRELQQEVFRIITDEMKINHHPLLTPRHEEAFFHYCIGEFDRSRTVDINVSSDPQVVTPSVVERLRDELDINWPLWRIRVHCERDKPVPENDILIYPDAVFVGRRRPTVPLADAVSDWAQEFREKQRSWYAAEYRRFRWIEQRVKECLPEMGDKRYCLLAVFVNNDEPQQELWVLIRGDTYTYVAGNARPDGCDIWGGSVYPVDPSGTIGRSGGDWKNGMGINVFAIPTPDQQVLVLRKNPSMSNGVDGEQQEWPLPYDQSDIVTDAALEEWERNKAGDRE